MFTLSPHLKNWVLVNGNTIITTASNDQIIETDYQYYSFQEQEDIAPFDDKLTEIFVNYNPIVLLASACWCCFFIKITFWQLFTVAKKMENTLRTRLALNGNLSKRKMTGLYFPRCQKLDKFENLIE